VKEIKTLRTLQVDGDFRLGFLSNFHGDLKLELEDCTQVNAEQPGISVTQNQNNSQ